MSWYTGTPPPWALVAVQVVGLACALLVVAQRRPHLAFVGLWIAYTSLTALWGSSGKVMHNDVLTVLVAAVFLFASGPARDGWAERRVRYGWPPRAALAVLAMAYFVSGAQKLVHSGPEWVFSDTMTWILRLGLSAHLSGGARTRRAGPGPDRGAARLAERVARGRCAAAGADRAAVARGPAHQDPVRRWR